MVKLPYLRGLGFFETWNGAPLARLPRGNVQIRKLFDTPFLFPYEMIYLHTYEMKFPTLIL